jgi:hypothetical protein
VPRVEYERIDFKLTIRPDEEGGALASSETFGVIRETRLSHETLSRWAGAQETPIDVFRITPPLNEVFDLWRLLLSTVEENPVPGFDGPHGVPRTIMRLTVDVAVPELAGLDWEAIFRLQISMGRPVIRVSQTRPRALSNPFTLPMRVLHFDPTPGREVAGWVRSVFGERPAEEVARVVQFHTPDFEAWGVGSLPEGWPTVEVLHFDRLPTLADPSHLFSADEPETKGTLGWLSRWTNIWRTRLVFIQTHDERELVRARLLAALLAGRGGPAVIVVAPEFDRQQRSYRRFYDRLMHDEPHDTNFHLSFAQQFGGERCALFAGAGREEALRFSNVALGLLRLEEELSEPRRGVSEAESELEELVRRHQSPWLLRFRRIIGSKPKAVRRIEHTLGKLRLDWDASEFEFQEREDVLPLSEMLQEIREAANVTAPRPASEPEAAAPPRRFVNSSLWRSEGEGESLRIEQKGARLFVGETVHLGIQIGLRDAYVRTYGADALIEEVFAWEPGSRGVWLEVGVTGLDFEVLGDPVQELWLPREGDSDLIHFAVVPRTSGVARLRFCVYSSQNVIQSFRLAALTLRRGEPADVTPKERRRMLAEALDIKPEAVGDVGYLPRLEYSTSTRIQSIETRPPRALSIVANKIGGKRVLTVKGQGVFSVQVPGDLKQHVENIRGVMKDISTHVPEEPKDMDPELKKRYAWGIPDPENPGDFLRNAGSLQSLSDALTRLAENGWQLFTRLISDSKRGADGVSLRDRLARVLDGEGKVIHVAHILLEDVLPWSALYDRKFDSERRTKDGRPVERGFCPAALPLPDGTLPVSTCGVSPRCLLNPQRVKEREERDEPLLLEETVLCPLHFWGFRHVVEVPPLRVSGEDGEDDDVLEQQDRILSRNPVQLAVGCNTKLPLSSEHMQQLEEIKMRYGPKALQSVQKFLRDDVLDMVHQPALDLVYFYCHAYGDAAKGILPYLEFWNKETSEAGRIRSGDLAGTSWAHHPLVFLNGCGTVGFDLASMSPFVEALVRDCGASGVIGTEIPVWEQMASEFACRFLKHFLDGKTAGEAILSTRREFLSQNNPLGLVYTLYSAAQLRLAEASQPAPAANAKPGGLSF